MKRVINYFAMLLLCVVTSALIVPTKAFADNRVISGPVEVYSSGPQECVFRLYTDNGWRAECDYSYIHVTTATGSQGETELRFTIDENTDDRSRMGWIVLYDKKQYYPIFTFEINQAGGGMAPPATGAYFTNEIRALDDKYESVSWDTTSFSFKFMSNRNITMKVNGSTVTPSKTRNNNGYTYTYTLNMGINNTANVKYFTVDVTVDGTNVSGGNRNTYYISQNRKDRFFNEPKIVAGMINYRGWAYNSEFLKVRYTTNDDFEAWLTWDSYPENQPYYKRYWSGPVTKVNIGSQNYLNGTSGIFTVWCSSPSEPIPTYRSNVVLHIKCKNSSITKTIGIPLGYHFTE